jgi:hypothetical protein
MQKLTESGVRKVLGDLAEGWSRDKCEAWVKRNPLRYQWNPATGRCGAKAKTLREIGYANGKRLFSDMPPLPTNRKKNLSPEELAEYREGAREAFLNT